MRISASTDGYFVPQPTAALNEFQYTINPARREVSLNFGLIVITMTVAEWELVMTAVGKRVAELYLNHGEKPGYEPAAAGP